MTRFSTSTRAEAVVTAPPEDVWSVLSDPTLVAELTPYVRRISADGDRWRWELAGLSVLGVGVSPAFTERMRMERPTRIEFSHDPPAGTTERSGVEGWYLLEKVADGTRLTTSLEISLDLPLPRASGRAVRAAMGRVVDQMGERFSRNLLTHLGADQLS